MAKQKDSYWFAVTKYGIGWTPISWQGWLVTITFGLLYAGGVIVFYGNLLKHPDSAISMTVVFLLYATVLTAYLLKICSDTGKKIRR